MLVLVVVLVFFIFFLFFYGHTQLSLIPQSSAYRQLVLLLMKTAWNPTPSSGPYPLQHLICLPLLLPVTRWKDIKYQNTFQNKSLILPYISFNQLSAREIHGLILGGAEAKKNCHHPWITGSLGFVLRMLLLPKITLDSKVVLKANKVSS